MANVLGSKKLYRVPEEGMIKGVCAGLAHYFDIPVRLVRVIMVLSLFWPIRVHCCGLHHTGVYAGAGIGSQCD